MQEIRSSNPPVVNGICDPNKIEPSPSQLETLLEVEVSQDYHSSFLRNVGKTLGFLNYWL